MLLIQVVPGLLPRVDGIGDYALQLARALRTLGRMESAFLVCDPTWEGDDDLVEGFSATKVLARTTEGFVEGVARCHQRDLMNQFHVLVHFSPYSYGKRGCPFWLIRSLQLLAGLNPGHVHLAFHELDVTRASPWSSAFWVSPLQRELIRRLTRLGGFQYTNTGGHVDKLRAFGRREITFIPNFSTIGEPATIPDFSARRRDLVVFGRAFQRRLNYQAGADALARVCRFLKAERIVDIGEPIVGDDRSSIAGYPVVRRGRLSVDQLNVHLSTSIGLFLAYSVPQLTKSSVHAASCAHGLVSFVDDVEGMSACQGLVTGQDFVPVRELELNATIPLEALSRAVFDGYQRRRSTVAATTVAENILLKR
jgi:hypothetical protein